MTADMDQSDRMRLLEKWCDEGKAVFTMSLKTNNGTRAAAACGALFISEGTVNFPSCELLSRIALKIECDRTKNG